MKSNFTKFKEYILENKKNRGRLDNLEWLLRGKDWGA
jgi:hypothetical protein